jgi:rhamnose utilization protein RhaD (predicted bifunctional aldolase and dehydrogenase)
MSELDQLRILSARVGGDPLLVQAAGGNTSLKDDGVMWIKASGTWLRDANTRDIFVPVDHPGLMAALAEDDPRCETCIDFVRSDLNQNALRPSIETTVHALMPQRIVVHVHCVNTIAWAIRRDAEERLGERLAGFNWAFIPYARPGLPLSREIAARLRPGIDVLVLGNHGLVVAADSVDEAETLLNRAAAAVVRSARPARPPDLAALTKVSAATPYRPAADEETHVLATDDLALDRGAHAVFYPDHVVFLGTDVSTSLTEGGPLVAIPGAGVLVHKDAKPAIEPMGRCLADVMRRVEPGDPLLALTGHDIDQLVNWDAEKYRQTLTQPGYG